MHGTPYHTDNKLTTYALHQSATWPWRCSWHIPIGSPAAASGPFPWTESIYGWEHRWWKNRPINANTCWICWDVLNPFAGVALWMFRQLFKDLWTLLCTGYRTWLYRILLSMLFPGVQHLEYAHREAFLYNHYQLDSCFCSCDSWWCMRIVMITITVTLICRHKTNDRVYYTKMTTRKPITWIIPSANVQYHLDKGLKVLRDPIWSNTFHSTLIFQNCNPSEIKRGNEKLSIYLKNVFPVFPLLALITGG